MFFINFFKMKKFMFIHIYVFRRIWNIKCNNYTGLIGLREKVKMIFRYKGCHLSNKKNIIILCTVYSISERIAIFKWLYHIDLRLYNAYCVRFFHIYSRYLYIYWFVIKRDFLNIILNTRHIDILYVDIHIIKFLFKHPKAIYIN